MRLSSPCTSGRVLKVIAVASCLAIATFFALPSVKSLWHYSSARNHLRMARSCELGAMRMRANAYLRLPVSRMDGDGTKSWDELADEMEMKADEHITAAKYHERMRYEISDD
jgi:hypothetical protein